MSEREFVPLPRMLDAAASRGACLTAFDSGGGRPEFVQASLAACRDLQAPALFLGWSGAAKSFGFRPLVAMVRSLAAEAGVPAGLHLDHAEDEADVRAAVDAGFSSVMFDGAEMPLDENIEATKRLVEYARERGAFVEGAVGGLGREGGGGGGDEGELTDPAAAERFAGETGVAVLAPAVGNRHGVKGYTIPLDWPLIEALGGRVGVPMALHGGSGIAMEDVKRAAASGFLKLNLATVLHGAYDRAVKDYIGENPDRGMWGWSGAGRAAIEEVARRYIGELGMAGAAADLQ